MEFVGVFWTLTDKLLYQSLHHMNNCIMLIDIAIIYQDMVYLRRLR